MSSHNGRKARETARIAERQQKERARAWFAPKRFGLGTGMPIRWQGWLTYALYLAAIAGAVLFRNLGGASAHLVAIAIIVAATAVLFVICARHTHGGWKWRWGSRD